MPAINLPTINIGEGDFKSKETMENILDTLMKYRKELNYLLMNLDVENMPTIGGLIGDINGDYSLLSQTVNGITMQVGNIQGDVSSLQIQANGIIASVSNNTGDIASLVLTAQGIQTQVNDNAGNISTLTQTASGLQSQVTSLDSYTTSQITQLSSQISLKVTSADVVNMLNVNTAGVQINANNIDLTGITTIYSTSPTQSYARFGTLSDFFIYSGGNKVFEVFNGITHTDIKAFGSTQLRLGGSTAYTFGTWDFSSATVAGLQLRFS